MIGDTAVKLGGNIKTSDEAGGAISITGPVTLTSNVIVDADAANTTVTFSGSTSKVNAETAGSQSLTIDTGAGNVVMGGAIGDSKKLSALKINSDTTGAGNVTLANIGASGVGISGNTAVGNTNTALLTLGGTVYKTTGSQSYTAKTGDFVAISNAATFTTTGNDVLFNTADVVLADQAHLTITTGGGGGNITFGGAIHGTAGTDANNTNIAGLTSGTGTVTLKAVNTDIEDITISGPTVLTGDITTTNEGVISITGNTQVGVAMLVKIKIN